MIPNEAGDTELFEGKRLCHEHGQRPAHPLDPLTEDEISVAASIVREKKHLDAQMRFETIVLDEPTPEEIDAFDAGQQAERRAFAATYDVRTGDLFEAIISISRREVLSWTARPGARPRFSEEELLQVDQAVCRDPAFVNALAERGITDLSLVCADGWSTGILGDPIERDHRIAQAFVWVRNRPFDNQYAHPVDGLSALVDVSSATVLRVDDRGKVPIPRADENYARRFQREWREGVRPIEIVQPQGPSFVLEGNQVTWCGWRFRVGFTPREGVVLHSLSFRDGGRWRSVVRRASLAEMIVPYGSPKGAHARKNAFDCGEYGVGALANSLKLGCDCLGSIHYFDAAINRMDGSARIIRNAVCMHEEDAGILWKHTDFRTGEVDVRRARRLVISFIATVGNYEYGFYWHLYLDGSIELEVKLTGSVFTSGLPAGGADPHGTLVAPGVVAHIHQHLFNVRLDMEIDGPENTVMEVDTVMDPPGPENPYGNATRLRATPLTTEKSARRHSDPARWRFWAIVNRKRLNRVGEPVGFRLVPQSAVRPMGLDNSQLARRGGFAYCDLWVTPTSRAERWPAGDYVNQSGPGEGIPRWTEADRPITDTRLTVWHTFGHHHIPRPEDFPIQTVLSCGFKLQPFGFFDRNPTLDVPPTATTESCCV